MRKRTEDLTHVDIKFLKLVQEINDNPEDYEQTDLGVTPANTRALIKNSELSPQQVRYRIRPYLDGKNRGFDHLGLVELHDHEGSTEGLSARSVEVTEAGRLKIQDWQQRHGDLELDESARPTLEGLEADLMQLRGRLEEKEERIESLESELSSLRESQFGAVDDDQAEKIDGSIKYVARSRKFFQDVLGVDPMALDNDLTAEEARQQMAQQLSRSGD